MIDKPSAGVLLCRAIRVLACHDVSLVITSTEGKAYYFEMDGEPVQEIEVISRAAKLDISIFDMRRDGGPDAARA